MNVLIINLTRFGDLIQTQPVISGHRALGHRVGLVCLENFASAASLLDGVDRIFPLPGAGLLARLDQDWRLAVRDMAAFAADIPASFPADVVINLTPSVSSRLLTRALAPAGARVAGFGLDQFGFNADTSSWAAFLQMAGANRGASPFNICDIFRRVAGLRGEGNTLVLAQPDRAALDRADALLAGDYGTGQDAGHGAGDGGGRGGFLALQPGASEERRRWPVEHFVALARQARERHGLVPVLLGSAGEAALGQRFRAAYGHGCVDLMGRTSLTGLAGVLSRCHALVTNDTGTMHLAAGIGVPLVAVFLATAQPWDTGPYRPGTICLEPDMPCHPCGFGTTCPHDNACRRAVTPEAMFAALDRLMTGRDSGFSPGARVWLTRTGDQGFFDLVSLSGHGESDRALWIALQRANYLPFLDDGPLPGVTGIGRSLGPGMAAELSKILTSGADLLFLLSRQGMVLADNPRPQAKAKFLASWQRLQSVLAADKYLNILGLLWMFESQQCGEDLASLLRLIERYRALFASLSAEFA
ncbi:glycosyltransferase family 9 protein [Pseudodesulfovibrio pelocollis]|uniref:glycosyltransferase family 9 protein n=1 Tax=Pseudodesulfovibrio pelocollis TaxID=3051432 RepID=UPI00255AEB95|nr:glycosyltransferase family 9 protein [Pseudodesulfovibrio sp. SB368]